MSDKSVLKAKQDELGQLKDKLVNDFLNEAIVRSVLAPLEVEIARLEDELKPKKAEPKKAEEKK